MSNRKCTIIEGIYRDFATPEDLNKVEELYSTGRKGPAIHKMMIAIRNKWIELNSELYKLKCAGKMREYPTEARGYEIKRINLF